MLQSGYTMRSMTPPSPRDARTTPQWLRLPVLALCVLMIVVFASAWYETKDDSPRTWIGRHYSVYWMANWSMFTNRNRTQQMLDAHAQYEEDGEWERVYMGQWFTARWESGLRFERRAFIRSPSRLRVLGAALCGRMDVLPEAERPYAVRFTEVSWRKTLGQRRQPRKKRVKRTERLEWECGREPPSPPKGRRI